MNKATQCKTQVSSLCQVVAEAEVVAEGVEVAEGEEWAASQQGLEAPVSVQTAATALPM